MKFWHFILFLILSACNLQEEPSKEEAESSSKDTVAIQHQIDSIETEMANAEVRLDSLKEFFDFVQNDFPEPSYYYKDWNRHSYNVAMRALLAGVDSSGHFFLRSIFHGGSWIYDGIDHTTYSPCKLKMHIGDSIYQIESDTLLTNYQMDMWICACGHLSHTYSRDEAFELGRIIAEDTTGHIKADCSIDDSGYEINIYKNEQKAIRDAYFLSFEMKLLKN